MLVFKIMFLFAVLAVSTSQHSRLHFYRRDYKYFEEFNSFYKLHWDVDNVSWNSAFMACDDEGAKLFYPKEEGEWAVIMNLTATLSELQNTTDVIVGIHDEIGQGEFLTVEGNITPRPIMDKNSVLAGQNCVIIDLNEMIYRTEPCTPTSETKRIFVCKREDDRPCRTIDLGYQYSKVTRKCYKINNRALTWQQAWQNCYMEGGMLVTPESNAEAEVLKELKTTQNTEFFIGIRRIFPSSDFYTLKGQRLEKSVFYDWNNNEGSDCVVLRSEQYLMIRNTQCDLTLPFICEMVAKV